jgi:5-methylcytosine-specific restriction protein A
LTLGNIVDHVIAKAEGGTDELDNLRVICKPCHVMKTAKEAARGGGRVSAEPDWLPESTVPVVVVCGPPGSGKSTYVQKRAATTDLVLDVDVIAAELFGQPLYYATKEQRLAAVRYRNKMLASLADKECGYPKVWLIAMAGTPDRREFWRRKYGDLVIMDTPKDECIQRVILDERRTAEAKRDAQVAIRQWW